MSINAGTVYSSLELDMTRYEQGLRQAEQQMNTFASNLGKIGKSMEKAGKAWTTKVTLPIVGLGAAAIKVGADFEKAMSEVKAISGATGEDIKILEDAARDMGKATSKSATEAAEALKYMSLAGWDVKTSVKALEPVLRLAEAGNLDLARTSDLVTDSMASLGVSVEDLPKYLDQVAQTSRKSNTDMDALMEAMVVAGGTFKNLNTPLDEANTLLGVLANRGTKGSEAGTALNSIMVNLTTGAGQAGKAMEELEITAFDTEGRFKGMTAVLKEVAEKTAGMTEEQRNSYLAMIGGKTQLDTLQKLLAGVGDEYVDLRGDIQNSTGALNEMASESQDNLLGELEKLKSALSEVGIQIFKNLLPHLQKFVTKLQEWTEKFSALDPVMQETILKIMGIAAAIGPVLLIGGKMATGISAISGLMSTFTGATATAAGAGGLGALGTGLGTTLLAIAPWAVAIAGAGAAVYGLYKHFTQDAIPAIDVFGDTVSESTKTAVGGFLDLEKEATLALDRLAWSGDAITDEMAASITGTFEQMGQQVLTHMQSDHAEQLISMQNFFKDSEALTQEEEASIIANMEIHQQEQADKVAEGQRRVNEIMEEGKADGLGITEERRQEMDRIQQEMTEAAIKYMSESEREQVVILERLKLESSKISAEQAAEVVRNSLAQKEETIVNAEEQYNKVIAEITKQRDEAGSISEEQARKLMEDAKMQYEEVKTNAEKMHEDVVSEAKLQAAEHVNEIEWSTGEIKSKWTVMVEEVTTEGKRLARITTESFKELGEDIAKTWSDTVTNTKESWDKIVSSVSSSIKEVGNKISEGIDKIREWNETNVKEKVFSIVEKVQKVFSSVGSAVSNAASAVGIGKNAQGTNYWKGGLTWVGEQGPELIDLPKSSKVYSNQKSMDMAKTSSGGITQNINIYSPTPLSPSEIARQNLRASRQLAMEWGV